MSKDLTNVVNSVQKSVVLDNANFKRMIMLKKYALSIIATGKLDVPQMLDVLKKSGNDSDVAQAVVAMLQK